MHVSDYQEFAHAVYRDACAKCSADVSDLRDIQTLDSRVENEGLSFLTITLPQFASDFERSLAVGHIDSTAFRNFRKAGSIPAFLQGMTSLIFDRKSGNLLPYTDETSTLVESVRQICLTFKKMKLPCSSERMARAVLSYRDVECELSAFSASTEMRASFSLVSKMLWNDCLRRINVDELRPQHSSGATADRVSGNQKYDWRMWHSRLEPYFPLIGSAFPIGIANSLEDLEKVTIVPENEEIPVRVILVPKTLKAPRVIAAEPACMQFAQQGILRELVKALEGSRLAGGHLNFSDQSINRNLALTSSASGQFVTIDLSDASDRVPRDLALEMFDEFPELQGAIDSCRSRYATLPDGSKIGPLNKFASMGSALCFPIEAMYFYTICVIACLEKDNLPVNTYNLLKVTRGIYVYGDDIIVPARYADIVLDYLRKYNCKVNVNKTFCSGNFRESCGIDAFNGYEVTPTYLRHLHPENKQQSERLVSWTATANLFYKKGYWQTARLMFNIIERYLGPLPYLADTSSGLGRTSFTQARSIKRWNVELHRFEVKAWTAKEVRRTDVLDGFPALMKSFRFIESNLDNVDPLHLERSALPHAVTLKREWVPSLS